MKRIEELSSQVVTWDVMMKAQKIFHGQILTQVLREMELADRDRQKTEDSRANHRNFNRMLTLVGAMVIGLIVTYGLYHGWIPDGKALGPYSFTITIAMDTGLALYGLIKRY
jgi:hypothetical protein